MSIPTDSSMHPCPSQVFHGDHFTQNGFYNFRTRDEHFGNIIYYKNKIR